MLRTRSCLQRAAMAGTIAVVFGSLVLAAPVASAAAGAATPASPLKAAATAAPTGGSASDPVTAASKRLAELVESYWQRSLELNPIQATFLADPRYNDRLPNTIGEAWLAQSLALEKEYLAKLQAIDPARLSGQDRLTYDIFERDRTIAIEGFRFHSELLPVNQFFGLPQLMAQLGSGTSAQPFQTPQDYENWLKRLDGFVVWTDQAIANMRRGADKGIVQPRVLMERVVPQLDKLIAAKPEDSVFWRPVANFPKGVPAAEQQRLRAP